MFIAKEFYKTRQGLTQFLCSICLSPQLIPFLLLLKKRWQRSFTQTKPKGPNTSPCDGPAMSKTHTHQSYKFMISICECVINKWGQDCWIRQTVRLFLTSWQKRQSKQFSACEKKKVWLHHKLAFICCFVNINAVRPVNEYFGASLNTACARTSQRTAQNYIYSSGQRCTCIIRGINVVHFGLFKIY